MPDQHFTDLKLARIYDLQNPWADDMEFYLNCVSTYESIIDLGCGTGTLAISLADKGHDVIGVDPAKSMLDIAKTKSNSEKVKWQRSTAQEYSSEKPVDTILMTGHAFQVLLSDQDIIDSLKSMYSNLKNGGRIIFETRNPRMKPWNKWTPEKTTQILELDGEKIKCFVELKNTEGEYVVFDNVFDFPYRRFCAESKLRFASAAKISALAESVGLIVEEIFGDWDRTQFEESISKEAIFSLRKRK